MKRVFEIEFPNNPSVLDIRAYDLRECMFHSTCIFPRLQSGVTVTDITDEIREEEYGEHLVSYPTQDAWDELHVKLDCYGAVMTHMVIEDWLHEHVFVDDDAVFEQSEQRYPVVTYRGTELTYVPFMFMVDPEDFWADSPSTPFWGIPFWIFSPQANVQVPNPNLTVAREAMADFDRVYWQEIEDVIRDFASRDAEVGSGHVAYEYYDLPSVHDLMEWRDGFCEWINGRE